ncbi:unnamed protein product, partial [Notodromas monacha]
MNRLYLREPIGTISKYTSTFGFNCCEAATLDAQTHSAQQNDSSSTSFSGDGDKQPTPGTQDPTKYDTQDRQSLHMAPGRCFCCEAATLDDAQTHSTQQNDSSSTSFSGDGDKQPTPGTQDPTKYDTQDRQSLHMAPGRGWMLRQLGQQQHALRKRASFRLPVERGKTESFRRSANGYSFPTALARTSDSVGDVDEDHGGSEEDFYSPVWRSASSRRRSRNWRSEDPNRVGLPSVPDEWAARFLGRPYQAWEPKNVFKSAKKRSDPFSSEKRHLGSVMKDIGFHGLPWIYFPHQAHHDKKKRFLSAVTFPYRHLAEEDSDTEDFEPMTQSGEEDNEYPTDKRHIGSAIASGYVKAIGKRSDDDSDVGDYDGILPQDIADDDDVEEDDLDDDL